MPFIARFSHEVLLPQAVALAASSVPLCVLRLWLRRPRPVVRAITLASALSFFAWPLVVVWPGAVLRGQTIAPALAPALEHGVQGLGAGPLGRLAELVLLEPWSLVNAVLVLAWLRLARNRPTSAARELTFVVVSATAASMAQLIWLGSLMTGSL